MRNISNQLDIFCDVFNVRHLCGFISIPVHWLSPENLFSSQTVQTWAQPHSKCSIEFIVHNHFANMLNYSPSLSHTHLHTHRERERETERERERENIPIEDFMLVHKILAACHRTLNYRLHTHGDTAWMTTLLIRYTKNFLETLSYKDNNNTSGIFVQGL